MTNVIISKANYDKLMAVVEKASAVHAAALVARGIDHQLLQSDIAMVQLKMALDAALDIEVTPYVDSNRTHATKSRRR